MSRVYGKRILFQCKYSMNYSMLLRYWTNYTTHNMASQNINDGYDHEENSSDEEIEEDVEDEEPEQNTG